MPDRDGEPSATVDPGVERKDLAGGGMLVRITGPVDRGCARAAGELLRNATIRPDTDTVVVDVSEVDEINGALLGTLVRAARRLAWRNRTLVIVCAPPELRQGLQMAGLDELAELVAASPRSR